MTKIVTDSPAMMEIIEWLMIDYGSDEHMKSWAMPEFEQEELPWPPGVAEIVLAHDPTLKNLGPLRSVLTINNDELAALVKLKFADVIIP